MQQVLFHIPFTSIPVYGYGMMLFFAFVGVNWLARRLCRREGIDGSMIPDLAIWLFIFGIAGGRLVFVLQYWHSSPETGYVGFDQRPLWEVIKLWDGGLVLYGALFGGALGYFIFHHRYLKKHNVSSWKMLDVVAPCIALGVAFGRIGCLFTGCCYGNVACATSPVVPLHFPVYTNSSPAHDLTAPSREMIKRGYQTQHGFIMNPHSLEVESVEPGTPAADAGLKPGDVIVKINQKVPVEQSDFFPDASGLQLTVRRGQKTDELPAFRPTSIGLNPTQPFETITMCLLLFFLLSYYPFKRRDGELMVILMLVYGVHRFLNEMLRTDTDPVAFGLTLSQNISLGILATGVILGILVWRRPPISESPPSPEMSQATPGDLSRAK